MANVDFNLHVIARENLFHPYVAGLIFYNAGRAPYDKVRASADVIVYRLRPALVRSVSTQEKNLKTLPVLVRLSN